MPGIPASRRYRADCITEYEEILSGASGTIGAAKAVFDANDHLNRPLMWETRDMTAARETLGRACLALADALTAYDKAARNALTQLTDGKR
jgi:hypothetical protein